MLKKEQGYPRFRSVGYTDKDIAAHLRKKSLHFESVNELMIKKMGSSWDDYIPESYLESI